jgi:chorismate-pyruvate lyase
MPDSTNASHVYPLSEFYGRAGRALPPVELIPGEAVPEPYRSLLVHANDMTPTLEAFHEDHVHLEILHRVRRGDFYFRQVILRLVRDERPVEFGANKIYVGRFPEDLRELILADDVPLGRILRDFQLPHVTEARAFLRVQSDDIMGAAFELNGPTTLYGRKAVISDLQGRPLSEIVEILPP